MCKLYLLHFHKIVLGTCLLLHNFSFEQYPQNISESVSECVISIGLMPMTSIAQQDFPLTLFKSVIVAKYTLVLPHVLVHLSAGNPL